MEQKVVLLILAIAGIIIYKYISDQNHKYGKSKWMRRNYGSKPLSHSLYNGTSTKIPKKVHSRNMTPPKSFDCRENWRGSARRIEDQGLCGACWAFSVTSMISWRYFIETDGAIDIELSAQDILTCSQKCRYDEESRNYSCVADFGCKGGTLDGAITYGDKFGFVDSKCRKFSSFSNTGYSNDPAQCTDFCDDGRPKERYHIVSPYNLVVSGDILATEKNVMRDIMMHGPVAAFHTIYDDFYSYGSGIYQETSPEERGADRGGHAVLIIGWGENESMGKEKEREKYWLCQNSWGVGWGERGLFKIRRGVDCYGFESTAILSAYPDVTLAKEF